MIMDDSPVEVEGGTLVVITGASRGIGRAIALAVADAVVAAGSHGDDGAGGPLPSAPSAPLRAVLIARSAESLRETARLVEQRFGDGAGGDAVSVSCHAMDLSDLGALPETLAGILEPLSSERRYDSCWLINNAGSLGPLGPASSLDSMVELRKAVDLNVTSGLWISSQFAKTFLRPSSSSSSASGMASTLVRIVNISSLCAIEAFPTMSIYCAGKAGRDMFHCVLAKEQRSVDDGDSGKGGDAGSKPTATTQHFKVLNYAPGPCDTRMTDALTQCPVLDDDLHDFFQSSKRENKLVMPDDTAKKLVRLLSSDEFQSGAHVDYYDDEQ
ncbi:hypothetical protein ACHAWF_001356 [Thalassiosira exigua]